ncbi:hypothetical protein QTN25_006715 [Entamoeba marina]
MSSLDSFFHSLSVVSHLSSKSNPPCNLDDDDSLVEDEITSIFTHCAPFHTLVQVVEGNQYTIDEDISYLTFEKEPIFTRSSNPALTFELM